MIKRLVLFIAIFCSFYSCSSNNLHGFPDVAIPAEKLKRGNDPSIKIMNKSEMLDDNIFLSSKFLKVSALNAELKLCLPIVLDLIGFYKGDEKIIVPNDIRGLVFHHRSKKNRSSFIWDLFSMTSSQSSISNILKKYEVDNIQNNQVFTVNSGDELVLNGDVVFHDISKLNISREVIITEKQIKLLNFNKQVKIYDVKTPFSLKSLASICEAINF